MAIRLVDGTDPCHPPWFAVDRDQRTGTANPGRRDEPAGETHPRHPARTIRGVLRGVSTMTGERTKHILEPAGPEDLLRGWLLHAHKSRDRHDLAARRYEWRRYLFGGLAIALSAVAGSSVFASIGETLEAPVVIGVGVVSILAAVAAALQTFLDYPGRAARHHAAATRYKAIIRELEQVLTGDELDGEEHGDAWTTDLRSRLDALEEATPVVGEKDWQRIEDAYSKAALVGTMIGPPAVVDEQRVAPATGPSR